RPERRARGSCFVPCLRLLRPRADRGLGGAFRRDACRSGRGRPPDGAASGPPHPSGGWGKPVLSADPFDARNGRYVPALALPERAQKSPVFADWTAVLILN